ncbi:flagellar biosynthesis/type III secretory system protein [Candidatus Scalindua japonica]|uniref:Flagellar biosynthesis/type III secretory system protein n=1 Tax=Candidatus Scalindua japonica TaxID=1284222 RepID=A0A286TVY1_9BACT|nr:FliH/SctL family protein [Candidatus Scalindua japonica]GAX60047.1 flagellar biosynthesis/type III secretory system protein [Candidatus Scalindua japonica]
MSTNNVYKLPVVKKSFVLESNYTTVEKEEKRKKKEDEIERLTKESYQRGWDEALEKNREDVALICESMHKAIKDLKQERDSIWSKCEKEIIKLTFAIAKKTVFQEISESNSRIIEKVVSSAINRVKEKKY